MTDRPHTFQTMSETIGEHVRQRMERALPFARAVAASAGPLHSAWDVIFDAEAHLAGRHAIVDAESTLALLERYLPENR